MTGLVATAAPSDAVSRPGLLGRAVLVSLLLHGAVLGLLGSDQRDVTREQGPSINVNLFPAPAVSRLAASSPGSSRALVPASSAPQAPQRSVPDARAQRQRPVSIMASQPPAIRSVRASPAPPVTANVSESARSSLAVLVPPVSSKARRLRPASKPARKVRARTPPASEQRSASSAPAATDPQGGGMAGASASTPPPVGGGAGERADARAPSRAATGGTSAGTSARSGITRGPRPAAGNPPPRYPRMARRRGLEGRVLIGLQVSVDGTARDTVVVHSSGVTLLDRAARDAVSGWRFEPALDSGRAIPAPLRVPVVFRLDRQG